MNKALINNWNSVVHKDDTVYVLGDFGFGSIMGCRDILNTLNGKKILIKGNHDRHKNSAYISMGFSFVAQEMVLKFGKLYFKLSHYPYRQSRIKEWWEMLKRRKNYRDINRKKPVPGVENYLIHGHTHSGAIQFDKKKKQIHVGCFLNNYTPFSLYKIFDIIEKGNKK